MFAKLFLLELCAYIFVFIMKYVRDQKGTNNSLSTCVLVTWLGKEHAAV